MRRVCLMACANSFLQTLSDRLPKDIYIAHRLDCFDCAVCAVRLEGDGLPEWCREPGGGGAYLWATVLIGADNTLRFLPVRSTQIATTRQNILRTHPGGLRQTKLSMPLKRYVKLYYIPQSK
jgi:hypothetical protein